MFNLSDIRLPTPNERRAAKEKAEKAVLKLAGERPVFEEYENTSVGEYPMWLIAAVRRLSFILLFVTFVPSALRLYSIGSETFLVSIPQKNWAVVVGVCIVLSAEVGAVLFTLALAVFKEYLTRSMRWLLIGSIVVSILLSIIGNAQVSLWGHTLTAFSILEAFAPPVLTLTTAFVLKEVVLSAIRSRRHDQLLFAEALSDWKKETADPERHPEFLRQLANEIWYLVQRKNNWSGLDVDPDFKIQAVQYVIAQDTWYADVDFSRVVDSSPVKNDASENGSVKSRKKPSAKLRKTMDWLLDQYENNPDILTLPSRDLSDQIGVSHTTVYKAQQEILAELNDTTENN